MSGEGGRESEKKFIVEGFPAGPGSPTSLRFHASGRAARRRFYIFMAGESWRGGEGRSVATVKASTSLSFSLEKHNK